MNFFITSIDRINTVWLGNLLDKSPLHTIGRETVETGDPDIMQSYADFPLERFCKPNYGEVHCALRHCLSAGVQGIDRLIDKRILILSNVKDVIRIRMNRDDRTIDELSAVIFEASTEQRLLKAWAKSDPEVRVFSYDNLTATLGVLTDLCSWLEIKYTPTEDDIEEVGKIKNDAMGWFQWDEESDDLYEKIIARQMGSYSGAAK